MVLAVLTHGGRVTHICVSKLTWSAPNHYLNQCWNIINWNLRNKLQWNFLTKFIHCRSRKCIWKCRLQKVDRFVWAPMSFKQDSTCARGNVLSRIDTLHCRIHKYKRNICQCDIPNMQGFTLIYIYMYVYIYECVYLMSSRHNSVCCNESQPPANQNKILTFFCLLTVNILTKPTTNVPDNLC